MCIIASHHRHHHHDNNHHNHHNKFMNHHKFVAIRNNYHPKEYHYPFPCRLNILHWKTLHILGNLARVTRKVFVGMFTYFELCMLWLAAIPSQRMSVTTINMTLVLYMTVTRTSQRMLFTIINHGVLPQLSLLAPRLRRTVPCHLRPVGSGNVRAARSGWERGYQQPVDNHCQLQLGGGNHG